MSCGWEFGDGKTFQIIQDFRRADGLLAAQLTCANGLIDLTERRLVSNPAERLSALATAPAILGIG